MYKLLALILCLAANPFAGQVPDTDLWLFELAPDKVTKKLFPLRATNITNRPGYDNQPSFSPDDKRIYYVSIREDKQADVFFYEPASRKTVQLSKSKESEYSPVSDPVGPNINVVMVEADSAQRIHYLDAQSGNNVKRLEPDSIGYYTFINQDTVVYYKLTEPHSLRYHVISSGEDKWLGHSPTRTFRAINRHGIIYGLKDSASVTFYKYDFLQIGRAHV